MGPNASGVVLVARAEPILAKMRGPGGNRSARGQSLACASLVAMQETRV